MDVEAMKQMNYYQIISAMGKEAIKRKKAEGQTMHLAPLGYKNAHINGQSLTVIDLGSFPVVLTILNLRKKGLTTRAIAQCLNSAEVKSARGKCFSAMAVWRVLRNELRKDLSSALQCA
jgi:hypothetical protein